MADTRVLLRLLKEYLEHLQRHIALVRQEYQPVEVRWQVFRNVYEGDAADEFKPYWEHTTAGFREYIDQTQSIMKILEERIKELEIINQRGDLR